MDRLRLNAGGAETVGFEMAAVCVIVRKNICAVPLSFSEATQSDSQTCFCVFECG